MSFVNLAFSTDSVSIGPNDSDYAQRGHLNTAPSGKTWVALQSKSPYKRDDGTPAQQGDAISTQADGSTQTRAVKDWPTYEPGPYETVDWNGTSLETSPLVPDDGQRAFVRLARVAL